MPLLADLIETVPDAMAITDVDGNMRRINGPWLDLFGYGADDCIGRGLVMVLQPGATPSVDWMRGCALKPQRLEVVGRRKDGVRFPVDFRTTPLKTAHGAVGLVAARDLTDRWHAEERILRALEQERKRIADDIHDDSLQAVTAASLRVQLLRLTLHDPGQLAIVSALEELLDLTMVRLRKLMFELRPAALEGSGIAAAVRELLEGVQGETGVAFEVQTRLERDPPTGRRMLLYRIVEEAVKGAACSDGIGVIRVDLDDEDQGWMVRLVHDGAGTAGNGLLRERARLAGGWAQIELSSGDQHRVRAWIPEDPLSEPNKSAAT
ncbi:MAG TPA: PAS domain S-box protein [Candidatus Dormibacteraeota bacterium]|nr:PAS domain S-box protein [Candidatus Dormibacteraeota bacterium]